MNLLPVVIILSSSVITCVQGEIGEDVRVKGGALIQRVGKSNLIQNVVIVKKNFTSLETLQSRALLMINNIKDLVKSETNEENVELLEHLSDTLRQLTNSRKKRSLLPFVGNVLNQLFGVATENDLNREKERLDKIETWANNLGNIITSTVGVLNQHANTINNLTNTLNELSDKMEDKINYIERKIVIQDLTMQTETIVVETKFKMDALMSAHRGVVTVDLISPNELKKLIKSSVLRFLLKPLDVDVLTYYQLMNVKVVYNMVYIIIPFDNHNNMLMYKIIPFPMYVKEKPIILKEKNKIILEKKSVDLIGIWEEGDLDSCVEIKPKDFVCNHQSFFLQPIMNFNCINYLVNDGEDVCQYEEFQDDFKFQIINDMIYVFVKEEQVVNVGCKGKENKIKIKNLNVFPVECSLKIINMLYYHPTVFHVVKLNSSFDLNEYKIKLNVSHFELPRAKNIAKSVNAENISFFHVYTQKVMPFMTLTIPLIVIITIIVFIYVRRAILSKMSRITRMLERRSENNDES